ncbi:MAG: hypothetical protein NC048_09950, partial [Bacteroides sp.]|nr:hypothetical protein [Bacteroides sp.]
LVGKRDTTAGRLRPGSRAIEQALTDTLRREAGEMRIAIRESFAETTGKDGARVANGTRRGGSGKVKEV